MYIRIAGSFNEGVIEAVAQLQIRHKPEETLHCENKRVTFNR